jgi:protocatechuate 3,4-dioxygenase beta subunit
MQILVGLFVAIWLSQAAPAATTGRISGRVTTEGANTPIPGARIMLLPVGRPGGPISMPQAATDQEGRFVFDGLPPGEYRVDVQKSGFAPLSSPGTRPITIQVAAGQSVDDVRVQLQRGGVITGKLLDPSGEPFTDARIMAMRRVAGPPTGAVPRFIPAPMQGQQQTNDLGEFRVSGLAPGEYYVAAMRGTSALGAATTPASDGSARTVLTTTFYPGTTDPAGAQSIAVEAGKEVSNLIFTMQAAPAFRVSGFVVDGNGAPVARAMVTLMGDPRSGMFTGPAGNTKTEEDGRFVIADVPAGHYRVMAMVPMTFSSAGGGGGVVGGTFATVVSTDIGRIDQPPEDVVVADADVKGLRVLVRRPSQ